MPVELNASGNLSISGDVVGRDKIINNIQHIFERALTAAEVADKDQALEQKVLAQGVSSRLQRLQQRAGQTSDTAQASPYKGLQEYYLGDAELFFGRKKAIQGLIERVQSGPLTVLQAESGAGKTSLLQAGLMPRLIGAGHLPIYIRPYNIDPGLILKRRFISDLSQTPLLATAPLRDFLHQVNAITGPECALVVLIDQFEEFFSLLHEAGRAEFIGELAECLDDAALNVRWVLSMRAEFFGHLSSFRPRIRNPFENDYRLNQLTRAEAREVVEEPARRRGLTFQPEVVEAILNDLGGENVPPPEVQLVCSVLYDERAEGQTLLDRALYDRLQGAAGILRSHLQRTLERMAPEHRPLAQRLLEALISADGRRSIRSHNSLLRELNAALPRPVAPAALEAVLEQMVGSRLLRAHEAAAVAAAQGYETTSGLSYELLHDYLVSQIRVDPAVQARKAAQEMLEQEVRAYKRYKTRLSAEKLAILQPRLSELALTDDSRALIAESQKWLRRQQGFLRAGLGLVITLVALAVISLGLAAAAQQQRAQAVNAESQARAQQVTQAYSADLARQMQSTSEAAARQADDRSIRAGLEADAAATREAQAAAAAATVAVEAQIAATQGAYALEAASAAREIVAGLFQREGLVPVGERPTAFTFDGQRLWVVNRNSNSVQSIDPVSGATGAPVIIGQEPRDIVFDGQKLWVPNWEDNTLAGLDPASGLVGPVIPVGVNPVSVAYDGQRLWVANATSGTVQPVDPATGQAGAPIATDASPWELLWDGQRLWVVTYEGNSLQQIDPQAGAVVQTVSNIGVNPIALGYDGQKIWIADFTENMVRAYDPAARRLGPKIAVGLNPFALLHDGLRLWVANRGSNTVQTVDPATGLAGAPVRVGNAPISLGLANEKLWVGSREDRAVQALDPVVGDLSPAFAVAGGPAALISAAGRLWVANRDAGSTQSLDPATGRLSTYFVAGAPSALAFDGARLWVALAQARSLNAIDPATDRVSTVNLRQAPGGLAFDGARIWVSLPEANAIQAIDLATRSPSGAPIQVGGRPEAILFDDLLLWVANTADNTVQPIAPTTGKADEPIALAGRPSALASDGLNLWVALADLDAVQKIELSTFEVGEPIAVGNNPTGLAFDGQMIWVANYWSNTLQPVDPDTGQAGAPIRVNLGPYALHFDGARLWVANPDSNLVQYLTIRR